MRRPPSYPDERYDPPKISEFIFDMHEEDAMKAWSNAARQALWSGALPSLASSAMLSACAEREKGAPLAPTNATSRWIFGDKAVRQHRASLRNTVTGYAIHHASSTLWALIHEKLFEP